MNTPVIPPTRTGSGPPGVIRDPIIPSATSRSIDLNATDVTFKGLRGVEPLLLIPVRIETRFADAANGPQLWLRIFPDQFAIDSHDPDLTTDEWDAAQIYWNTMWPLTASDTADQQKAWCDLAAAFGPRRAAYVANVTGPADFDAWITGPGSAVLSSGRTLSATPPTTLRPHSWSNPAVARALPTQWFVMLTSGSTTQFVEITRPQNDLTVSPDPGATGALGSTGGPTDAMSWMSEFDQAQLAGMAVAIDISAEQRTTGFDQVAVFGVTGDFDGVGQSLLQDLLTAHRFTDGLAFVPQGTATKNSTDSVAGYTRSDPNFADSFNGERSATQMSTSAVTIDQLTSVDCSDGQMFAGLIGIDPATVAHTPNWNATDQRDAAAMTTASWTATGDYFLRYMMGLPITPAARDAITQFVWMSARTRGPIPALRIGTVPYGILPIMAMASIESGGLGFDPVATGVAALVQKAREIWVNTVNAFPVQVTPSAGGTPEQALANVLGRDASTVTVNARLDTGPWFGWNLGVWDIQAGAQAFASLQLVVGATLLNTGEGILAAVADAQGESASQAAALGWSAPAGAASGLLYLQNLGSNLRHVTSDGQVSETTYLPKTHFLSSRHGRLSGSLIRRVNVLEFMSSLSVTALLNFVPSGEDLTLLTVIVRQSLLLEYATAAGRVLNVTMSEPEEYTQPPGQQAATLLWALMQTSYTPPPGLPRASGTLGDYIQAQMQTTAGQTQFPSVSALLEAIAQLSTLSTAALDRVLTESLDLCSYRLDAWATAVATTSLLLKRAKAPTGLSLGVWGYVENLRPGAAQTLSADDLAAIATATGSAVTNSALAPEKDSTGFIFAPSLSHAATGAILRNGYLSHAGGTYTPAFAVDLSSTRVRAALSLMEGMRQGQPLGALLGYLFEQGLNDASLQVLLQPFRSAYPIVANKMTQNGSGPADAVAASNVVDGGALQGAWVASTITWGQNGLPASDGSDPNYSTVTGLLDMLSDRVDALNDLAVAESIYQVAKGNPARSGGALNASSREQHPPEPQVIETPRSGLDLTQRVLSTFAVTPATPPASTWLGSAPATPRANAEPWLEHWLDSVLPAPNDVQFQLTYTPSGGAAVTTVPFTLATMGLSALDLLSLAPPPPTGNAALALDGSELAGSDLDRWILAQSLLNLSLPSGATLASVVYVPSTPPAAPLMTVPQLLTVVRALQELLGAARSITTADFLPPGVAAPAADLDLSGVTTRLSAACNALLAFNASFSSLVGSLAAATLTSNNGDALSAQLMTAASFGFTGAPPVTTQRDSASLVALLAQATAISAAVGRRVTALTGNASLYNSTTNSLVLISASPQTLKLAQDTAEAIFGPKFMVLPAITPTTSGTTVDPLVAAVSNLAAGVAAWSAADHLQAAGVVQQLTHVRPPMARLDEVLCLSAVLTGSPVADLAVAQLGGPTPYSSSTPWLGTGPVSARFPWLVGTPAQSLLGSYALLDWTPPALGAATGASMCGLMFDEWIEQIPNSAEKTAIAFHYAEPGARAPQAFLLALTPPSQDNWSARLVRDVVLEAVAMAKIRTVDPQTLELGGQVGQLLPALVAGFGAFTVSSSIPGLPTSTDPTGS